MPEASVAELRAFAKTNTKRGGVPCTTCILPADVLKVLRQGRRDGVAFSVLSAYLKQKGLNAGEDSLAKHWRNHER